MAPSCNTQEHKVSRTIPQLSSYIFLDDLIHQFTIQIRWCRYMCRTYPYKITIRLYTSLHTCPNHEISNTPLGLVVYDGYHYSLRYLVVHPSGKAFSLIDELGPLQRLGKDVRVHLRSPYARSRPPSPLQDVYVPSTLRSWFPSRHQPLVEVLSWQRLTVQLYPLRTVRFSSYSRTFSTRLDVQVSLYNRQWQVRIT